MQPGQATHLPMASCSHHGGWFEDPEISVVNLHQPLRLEMCSHSEHSGSQVQISKEFGESH